MISQSAFRALIVLFGLSQLALGLIMVIAPGFFFDNVGPYGAENDHYVRDYATFYLALGLTVLAAVPRPSWRVPILALAAVQYLLHSVNHLVDVGDADPEWLGPANLAALLVTGALLAFMLVAAMREEPTG
jgi:hypothetical protein